MMSDWRRWRIVALFAVILAACVAPAIRAAGQAGPESLTPERLRRVIEERYRVVPLQDGVALVPRREMRDVKSIELSGNTVAINGTAVTGPELKDRLKADADAILALSYLEPAARKSLFEGTPPKTGEQAAQPAEPGKMAAPGAATPPEETADRTRYSRHSDARVHIGGPIHVAENESVDGPVVAIGGSVTVDGEVREDVVSVGGSVRLGPKARVRGDITSVGGTIQRDPGAEVNGRTNEVAFGFPHFRVVPGFWFPRGGFLAFGPAVELMASLFRMALFGILAFLVFMLAQSPVARIEQAAASEPWKAGLVGLLTEMLFIPVVVITSIILAVSILGIPLLLLFVPLAIVALIIALIFGFTGVAYRVGRWAEHRFGWTTQHPVVVLFVGLAAIWVLTIVGRVVGLGGWPIRFVSLAILLVGFVIEYVAWTVGLGAAVMTRFGTRPVSGGGATPVPTGPVAAGPQTGGAA